MRNMILMEWLYELLFSLYYCHDRRYVSLYSSLGITEYLLWCFIAFTLKYLWDTFSILAQEHPYSLVQCAPLTHLMIFRRISRYGRFYNQIISHKWICYSLSLSMWLCKDIFLYSGTSHILCCISIWFLHVDYLRIFNRVAIYVVLLYLRNNLFQWSRYNINISNYSNVLPLDFCVSNHSRKILLPRSYSRTSRSMPLFGLW